MADFPQAQNLNPLLTGALRDPAQLQKEQLMSWLADKQKEQATIEKGGGGFIQGLAPVVEGLDAMSGGLPGWLLGHGLNALDYGASKLPQSREDMTDQKALIPTKANLAKFLELMASANLKTSKKDFPTQALAEAFTAARYPKRYEKIAQALEVREPGMFEWGTLGSYSPATRSTSLLAPKGRGVTSYADSTTRENVGTFVHEAQHAIDHQRPGSSVKPEEFLHTSKGGKYIDARTDPEGYRNQNVEKRAFQAGATGSTSLDKFLELLPTPDTKNRKIEPRTSSIPASNVGIYKEWVNSAYNKALRDARKTIPSDNLPAIKAELKKARAKEFEDINWWHSSTSPDKNHFFGRYFTPRDTYPSLLGAQAKIPWEQTSKFAARVKPEEAGRVLSGTPNVKKIRALMELLNISASPRDNFFGVSRGKTKTAGR